MKNSMKFVGGFTFAVLAVCFLLDPFVIAEEKSEQFDNSRIKLIKEICLPEKINKCIVTTQLDMILSENGIYNVDDKLEIALTTPSLAKLENSNTLGIEDISPDKDWAVETVSDKVIILNLETGNKKETDFSGVPKFSAESILATSAMSKISYFFDFDGNLIKQQINDLSLFQVIAHKRGFVGLGGGGSLLFYDTKGNLLCDSHVGPENFDVTYNDGITAVITKSLQPSDAKHWTLAAFTCEGKSVFQHTLPFAGQRCGIGLSPEGTHVVVSSMESGLLMLFDLEQKKELWTKKLDLGWHFTYWPSPIAVASNAIYSIVHGKIQNVKSGYPLFIIIDSRGETIGFIDPETDKIGAQDHRIKFIPKTNTLVYHVQNTLKIYAILESAGAK